MRPPEPPEDIHVEQSLDEVSSKIIHVPTRKVGYLIGHGGRTIYGFEQQTGCKINIMAPNSKAPETPVSLVGMPRAISHCMRMIADLYGTTNFSSQLWKDNRKGRNGDIRTEALGSLRFKVHPGIVGYVVAHHAHRIHLIQVITKSKVIVHQDPEEGVLTPIDVVGSPSEAMAGIKMLRDLFDEYESESRYYDYHVPSSTKPSLERRKVWTLDGWPKSLTSSSGVAPDDNGPSRKRQWSGGSPTCNSPPLDDLVTLEHRRVFSKSNNYVSDFQPKFISESVIVSESEIEKVDLGITCKRNTVSTEVVKVSEESKNREIIISGFEPNVMNAKLDILNNLAMAFAV